MKVPSDIKVTSDQGSHTSNAQVTLSTTATFCVIYRFLSRGSTLAIAILYVRPSVRDVPGLDENGLTYCHTFFTVR